ncbi:MAG: hypothetical protein JST82_09790 [Bacteroidetes bacterium]|nr:hypothetical protein [Bacteroidota bacterium]
MKEIIITLVALAIAAIPAALLLKWLKHRKEHKSWLRLTGGQEATEL